MGSNRFWHIVSVVKERLSASLSCRLAYNNLISLPDSTALSTLHYSQMTVFHISPQPLPYLASSQHLAAFTAATFSHVPQIFFRLATRTHRHFPNFFEIGPSGFSASLLLMADPPQSPKAPEARQRLAQCVSAGQRKNEIQSAVGATLLPRPAPSLCPTPLPYPPPFSPA